MGATTSIRPLAERIEEGLREYQARWPGQPEVDLDALEEAVWGATGDYHIPLKEDPGPSSDFLHGEWVSGVIQRAIEAGIDVAKPVIIASILEGMRSAPRELLEDPRSEVLRADLEAASA